MKSKPPTPSSPQATLRSFIEACNELHEILQSEKYFDRNTWVHRALGRRILDCLDQSDLPAFARESRAGEVAACLKEILDREEWPGWKEIPDEAAIEAAGGFEKLSIYRIPGTRITISRVEEGPQKHEYLFSTGTVDRAVAYFFDVRERPYRVPVPSLPVDEPEPATSPGLYHWYMSAPGHPALVPIYDRLPESMKQSRTLGLATWKWPGVIIGVFVSLLVMALLYQALIKWTQRALFKKPVSILANAVLSNCGDVNALVFREFCGRVSDGQRHTVIYIELFIDIGGSFGGHRRHLCEHKTDC